MLHNLFILIVCLLVAWLLIVAVVFLVARRYVHDAALLIPNLAVFLKNLRAEPSVPWTTKLLIVLAMAWVLSPIDLVPEFIPFLGPIDDVVVVLIVMRAVKRSLSEEVIRRCWPGSQELLTRFVFKHG